MNMDLVTGRAVQLECNARSRVLLKTALSDRLSEM